MEEQSRKHIIQGCRGENMKKEILLAAFIFMMSVSGITAYAEDAAGKKELPYIEEASYANEPQAREISAYEAEYQVNPEYEDYTCVIEEALDLNIEFVTTDPYVEGSRKYIGDLAYYDEDQGWMELARTYLDGGSITVRWRLSNLGSIFQTKEYLFASSLFLADGSDGRSLYDAFFTVTFLKTEYNISFHANGGSCPIASKTVQYNGTYGELPVPTRKGYSFEGWFISPIGGTAISASADVEISADQTLYAHWEPLVLQVYYNANGGTCASLGETITYGSRYGTLPVPTRKGYTFAGWYTARTGGTKVTATTVMNREANVTLYARWTSNDDIENADFAKRNSKSSVKITGALSCRISWKKVTGATGYEIYRSTSKSKGYTRIGKTKKLTFTDNKAKSGRTCYYKVRAYNKFNVFSKYSNTASKYIKGNLKNTKIDLKIQKPNAVLTWEMVKNAKTAYIYIKEGSGKYKLWKKVNAKKKVLRIPLKEFSPMQAYQIIVKMGYTADGTVIYSKDSNIRKLSVK